MRSQAATSKSRTRKSSARLWPASWTRWLAAGMPAKIGSRRVLTGLNDPAPRRPRLGEEPMQGVGFPEANGPLQGGQILCESRQHLQHRLLVVEEDVAPHDGIGSGDAGKIAETTGRKLDHLGIGHALEMSGGIDDVVGNEMRYVAGDRQHQIMMLGIHDLDMTAKR